MNEFEQKASEAYLNFVRNQDRQGIINYMRTGDIRETTCILQNINNIRLADDLRQDMITQSCARIDAESNKDYRDLCYNLALNTNNSLGVIALVNNSNDSEFIDKVYKDFTDGKINYGTDNHFNNDLTCSLAGNKNTSAKTLHAISASLNQKDTPLEDVYSVARAFSCNPNLPDDIAKECIKFDYNYLDQPFKGVITSNIAEKTKTPEIIDMCLAEVKAIAEHTQHNYGYDYFILNNLSQNPHISSEQMTTLKTSLEHPNLGGGNWKTDAYNLRYKINAQEEAQKKQTTKTHAEINNVIGGHNGR